MFSPPPAPIFFILFLEFPCGVYLISVRIQISGVCGRRHPKLGAHRAKDFLEYCLSPPPGVSGVSVLQCCAWCGCVCGIGGVCRVRRCAASGRLCVSSCVCVEWVVAVPVTLVVDGSPLPQTLPWPRSLPTTPASSESPPWRCVAAFFLAAFLMPVCGAKRSPRRPPVQDARRFKSPMSGAGAGAGAASVASSTRTEECNCICDLCTCGKHHCPAPVVQVPFQGAHTRRGLRVSVSVPLSLSLCICTC